MFKQFRARLAAWIYTPPAPKHSVPDTFVEVSIPWRDEERIRTALLLAHDAHLLVFSSSGEDRHLAAARAGFTIPPHSLRLTEYAPGRIDQMLGRPGARIFDYSGHLANEPEETWPPQGPDPLADEAGCLDHGLESCRLCKAPKKRK